MVDCITDSGPLTTEFAFSKINVLQLVSSYPKSRLQLLSVTKKMGLGLLNVLLIQYSSNTGSPACVGTGWVDEPSLEARSSVDLVFSSKHSHWHYICMIFF